MRSPGGIILIVVLVFLIAAGVTFGLVCGLKKDTGSGSAWKEYEKATGKDVEKSEKPDKSILDAQLVLTRILDEYKSGGFAAISKYMAPELLNAYKSAPVSWDQVSWITEREEIVSGKRSGDHVVLKVKQTVNDGGDEASMDYEWDMVGSGTAWQVYNVTDLETGDSRI